MEAIFRNTNRATRAKTVLIPQKKIVMSAKVKQNRYYETRDQILCKASVLLKVVVIDSCIRCANLSQTGENGQINYSLNNSPT